MLKVLVMVVSRTANCTPFKRDCVASDSAPRKGFSLIELVVAIGIISLLVALGAPAITKARQAARRVQCTSHMRNVNMAMLNVVESTGRFPASGNFTAEFGRHHSWVVDVLPWLEQEAVANKWNKDRSIYDPVNEPLTYLHFPVLTCPSDISVVSVDQAGHLSYVVNGGVGYTVYRQGVHDCPVDPTGRPLDLNGDGVTCPPTGTGDGTPSDKDYLLRMGLFFGETWRSDISRRYHRFSTVIDGLSNTIVLSENVRTGYNPDHASDPWASSWASPSPKMMSFHIGNPCKDADCSPGNVDYGRSNAGDFRINSGLTRPEGMAPIPNSFHDGGVNMAFADGRVQFVSESIDGGVYAALVSPQGRRLVDTPLEQPVSAAP